MLDILHRFHRAPDSVQGPPKFSLLKIIFAALGFNTIFMLWLIEPGVTPALVGVFYHWSSNPKTLFLTIAVDVLGSWLVLTLLLLIGQVPGRTRIAIWAGFLLFTPWFLYQNFCLLLWQIMPHRCSFPLFFAALVGTVFLTVHCPPRLAQHIERIIASAASIMALVSIFGCFLLCKLAVRGWEANAIIGSEPLLRQQTASVIQPHRIFWIVFDELSYDQVYEHRFPGLPLPAFDALAQVSTTFTNVRPPGIYTERVLPGLLAGKTFDEIRTSDTEQLSTHNADSGQWRSFNQHDTVFQDALNAGYSTAIAGWYNPYCRLMPQVLDQCFWTFRDHLMNGMTSSTSVEANTLNALDMFSCMVITADPYEFQRHFERCRGFSFPSELLAESHVEDYEDLDAASQKLLLDRSASFVLLHLPIPHPGGIYDRATGKLSTSPSSTYIDNLALTDKCLAGLRATLERTGQWDSSTIVLMGDHSWRTTQIWKPSDTWTREEQVASHGGQYDPRPVYMVKLPGQTSGDRIGTLYHSVNTRKLFDELFAHKINTPGELAAWAQKVH